MAEALIHMQPHYSILKLKDMDDLRALFAKGEADDLNFVLFSTSGVHGHYGTIEDAEEALMADPEKEARLTVLVVHPRIVCMRYGHIAVTLDDIPWLKRLRSSSWEAVKSIGEN